MGDWRIMPSSSKDRFFIALLPPEDVQEAANKIKQHCADTYNSYAAQKSPPHITLQPPFDWEQSDLSRLEEHLAIFARNQYPIPVVIQGFGAFPPRVIFLQPLKTPELMAMQTTLMVNLEQSLKIVHQASKNRPFSPHVTVAFRDLSRHDFRLAWQKFASQELNFSFTVDQLTLLKHDGHCWQIHRDFPFAITE